MSECVSIVGAGLGGTLAAIYLARRGIEVTLYEGRPDLRQVDLPAGRSINLALANRGLKALRLAGLEPQVRKLLTVMRGRMIHPSSGPLDFQSYGRRPHEVIYSVSRPGLNALLLDAAEAAGVRVEFGTRCTGADFERDLLSFEQAATGERRSAALSPSIAADGAGSVLRHALLGLPGYQGSEDLLEHGYKELCILPDAGGRHRMDPNALHIWPRGGYMLIALPNLDGSFTVTLFLPNEGEPSFAFLENRPDGRFATPAQKGVLRRFFEREFPDVTILIQDPEDSFFANPTGLLGTVRCEPWHLDGRLLLLGDAAHAIVPFHGQGMNCAFEDCLALDRCLDEADGDWAAAFAAFSARRKPDADAIAEMALENYVEMRDSVRDPTYLLRKRVAFELERRFPERFSPRYSLVMFRDDVPYADAQHRGSIQAQILLALTTGIDAASEVDYRRAAQLVTERLEPLPTSVG